MPNYIVLYKNTTTGQYEFQAIVNGATDGPTANGQAAVNANQSGKYAAFDLSTAAVDDITVAPAATVTPGTF